MSTTIEYHSIPNILTPQQLFQERENRKCQNKVCCCFYQAIIWVCCSWCCSCCVCSRVFVVIEKNEKKRYTTIQKRIFEKYYKNNYKDYRLSSFCCYQKITLPNLDSPIMPDSRDPFAFRNENSAPLKESMELIEPDKQETDETFAFHNTRQHRRSLSAGQVLLH